MIITAEKETGTWVKQATYVVFDGEGLLGEMTRAVDPLMFDVLGFHDKRTIHEMPYIVWRLMSVSREIRYRHLS